MAIYTIMSLHHIHLLFLWSLPQITDEAHFLYVCIFVPAQAGITRVLNFQPTVKYSLKSGTGIPGVDVTLILDVNLTQDVT